MKIGYDPVKNERNLALRHLSFDDVVYLEWGNAHIELDDRHDYGELRYVAMAYLEERLHVVCFTWRGDQMWIISFRKANKREERYYEEAINR